MLIVEYERFTEDGIDVLSIIDEESDTVVAMYQDEELQRVLEHLVKEQEK